MSDMRKKRKEVKQGLHQYLMALYTSFLETHTPDEAKKYITFILNEEFSKFSPDQNLLASFLRSTRNKMNEKIKEEEDKDTALYLSEQLQHLDATIKILESEFGKDLFEEDKHQ